MRVTAIFNNDPLTSQPLPLFQSGVKAGFPSPAEEESSKNLDLNDLLISHPAATFFVRVVGDSMEGAGIFSGDLLLVDRSLPATHGKIIVAIFNGEFTVKRMLLQKDTVILAAENPAYPPLVIPKDSDFLVWGLVTYVIHKT